MNAVAVRLASADFEAMRRENPDMSLQEVLQWQRNSGGLSRLQAAGLNHREAVHDYFKEIDRLCSSQRHCKYNAHTTS